METTIERDPKEHNIYTITIQNNFINGYPMRVENIVTTWARTIDTHIITQWVSEVNKTHSKNKAKNKNQKDLIVGLVGERSKGKNYAKGSYFYLDDKQPKDMFEIINVCIGQNCLVCEVCMYDLLPKALRDLFSSNRTVVVGVGIQRTVELMASFGVKVARAVELRELCHGTGGAIESLAKAVLGEEWEVDRPTRMTWWEERFEYLSEEKMMFGTLDVFLVYLMGVKLLGSPEN